MRRGRPSVMRADLEPQKLLAAYAAGVFPMAGDAGELHWLAPDPRAVMGLDSFKYSRSLGSVLRNRQFSVTANRAFERVVEACADRSEGTWISDDIREAYTILHRIGFAHSVEVWHEDCLAGGLYGVTIGGAFFGESMFHKAHDASKVALVHLVRRLREREFSLLDIQFMTDHLRRFGATEISRESYERQLADAIRLPRCFVDKPGESLVLDMEAPQTP